MNAQIEQALKTDTLIDITTYGKKTGNPRRIEILFHNFDGRIYISGRPGKRDWYANLLANPQFIFHVKQSATADIAATATPITDDATRRAVLVKILAKWNRQAELEIYVQSSPLVSVQLDSV